jgi:hypothetical protein
MSIWTRVRERFHRRYDIIGRAYVPERYTPAGDLPVAAEDTPTATMPAPDYDPAIKAKLAELKAQAEADALAAQASAQTETWGTWDQPIGPAPSVPAHEPPPMPPSGLSRAMVSQIPSPPANDRNFSWTHEYAEYMRRVGVATGTATDLEHTMAWGVPALKPGDGTGERL